MNRMPALLITAAVAVAALAGCSPATSSAPVVVIPSVTKSATPTPTPTPTPTRTPVVAVPSIPGPQLPGVDPGPYMTGIGGDGVEFNSPSGNIHCGIYVDSYSDSGGTFGCSIDDYHYTDPAPTAETLSCSQNVNYGGGFIATFDGPVETLCRGGLMFGGEAGGAVNVLAYGTSVLYNDVVCESYQDYTGCRSLITGHGFTLARGEFTVS